MTKKLLLTIALGAALAVAAAGTAASVDLGGTKVTVPKTVPNPLPACANLIDDDGDGSTDLADPGCENNPLGTSEYNAPPPTGGGDTGGGTDGSGGTTTTTPSETTTTTGTTRKGTGGGKGGAAPRGGLFGKRSPKGGKGSAKAEREKFEEPPLRNPDGSPTQRNPSRTQGLFGPAPIGVSDQVIDSFEIPAFQLPLFQAYGAEYGVPWQVLAAIAKVESDFCRLEDLVSSAGALGCMQFIPSTWKAYGCDGNEDGIKDPYNLVDSICAAARYLRACGAEEDLPGAIFCYNHAEWYVDLVLDQAKEFGLYPDDLVGSITGLVEGMFPVQEDSEYADDVAECEAATRRGDAAAAADVCHEGVDRSINIYSRVNAPVVAVNDGVITDMGTSDKLGKYIVLTDAYGNRFTYAHLGEIADEHPVLKERALTAADFKLSAGSGGKAEEPAPAKPASSTDSAPTDDGGSGGDDEPQPAADKPAGPVNTEGIRERLFANPERSCNVDRSSVSGQLDSLLCERVPAYETFKSVFSGVFKFDRETMELRELKVGSQVIGGTVLGHIGKLGADAPHVTFAIRPAGRGAPKVEPKPILDALKLRERTGIYRAAGKDPFGGSDATIGQILLMSKEVLAQRVLANPMIEIYDCGRTDIESGQIDRRVLATLEYLVERGYRIGVTSLKCGHSYFTTSGNRSAHSWGGAVDIATINGRPVLGNQGPGSITEAAVRDLLKLQGAMRCAQIITLMDLGGPTFAMSDHHDHIHCGFNALFGTGSPTEQLAEVLKPDQWERLIDVLGEIENPDVRVKPSEASLPAGKAPADRGSSAHIGE